MYRAAEYLHRAGHVATQARRNLAQSISNQKQKPKPETSRVLIGTVATASFTTGIIVAGQYAERKVYESKTIQKAKDIETDLQNKNLLTEGWHGIDLQTLRESTGNPNPVKNTDGSIPISRVIKAGACAGQGGKVYPAVSRSEVRPVENVSVGEFSAKRCDGKHSTAEPDITKDAWQTSITVAGQKSGRAFVLVPKKQKEIGVEDVSLDWSPPPSIVHDFLEKYGLTWTTR